MERCLFCHLYLQTGVLEGNWICPRSYADSLAQKLKLEYIFLAAQC